MWSKGGETVGDGSERGVVLQVQRGEIQEVGVSKDEEGDKNRRGSGTTMQYVEEGKGTL